MVPVVRSRSLQREHYEPIRLSFPLLPGRKGSGAVTPPISSPPPESKVEDKECPFPPPPPLTSLCRCNIIGQREGRREAPTSKAWNT